METALGLARRGLGRVWPNPAVGCVLTAPGNNGTWGKDARPRIVGRGWTQPGGRPHAETKALSRAGSKAKGATAYISLEPCAHTGKTPPCVEALIKSGISRVVVALEDPDPRVSGKGIAALKKAGIVVDVGLHAQQAQEVNAGFFMRVREGRPLVTLKLASTLDGRIATHHHESRWITGETSRQAVHGLRLRNDVVMVGSGTAWADDPDLTCRLPGLAEASPVRVVMDARLRLSLTSRLVRHAGLFPTWLVTRLDGDRSRIEAYTNCGVEVIKSCCDKDGNLDPLAALEALAKRGVTRVLVEGGGYMAAAMLGRDLVDRLMWFRAPRIIGGDGRAAVAPFGVDDLTMTADFTRLSVRALGEDILEIYGRRAQ
jgi:diaminohydroxyphosphoribosylaminopyrimidine deaminase/5-amino-6-(5-phosphoribosylamino)uracil reductase